MKSSVDRRNPTDSATKCESARPEAAPPDHPVRLPLAGGNRKAGAKKEDLKGCLMCGACGSVGHCVLD